MLNAKTGEIVDAYHKVPTQCHGLYLTDEKRTIHEKYISIMGISTSPHDDKEMVWTHPERYLIDVYCGRHTDYSWCSSDAQLKAWINKILELSSGMCIGGCENNHQYSNLSTSKS